MELMIVGVLFTAFAAWVFTMLTLLMGVVFKTFELSAPDDWTFLDLYKRYLIIAAVFTFVTLPLGRGLLGIAPLALAYKFVFRAGWSQAVIMGTVGGLIAILLFWVLIDTVLRPLGLF
jgi:hypothetical protein